MSMQGAGDEDFIWPYLTAPYTVLDRSFYISGHLSRALIHDSGHDDLFEMASEARSRSQSSSVRISEAGRTPSSTKTSSVSPSSPLKRKSSIQAGSPSKKRSPLKVWSPGKGRSPLKGWSPGKGRSPVKGRSSARESSRVTPPLDKEPTSKAS